MPNVFVYTFVALSTKLAKETKSIVQQQGFSAVEHRSFSVFAAKLLVPRLKLQRHSVEEVGSRRCGKSEAMNYKPCSLLLFYYPI